MHFIITRIALLDLGISPRARARVRTMAMALVGKHCADLLAMILMLPRVGRQRTKEGREGAPSAQTSLSLRGGMGSLALTSPNPHQRARRAWNPVAQGLRRTTALTSAPRPGVSRA